MMELQIARSVSLALLGAISVACSSGVTLSGMIIRDQEPGVTLETKQEAATHEADRVGTQVQMTGRIWGFEKVLVDEWSQTCRDGSIWIGRWQPGIGLAWPRAIHLRFEAEGYEPLECLLLFKTIGKRRIVVHMKPTP